GIIALCPLPMIGGGSDGARGVGTSGSSGAGGGRNIGGGQGSGSGGKGHRKPQQ
ncbi:hypothetical protein KI387_044755, partial [Taxus chinensis]